MKRTLINMSTLVVMVLVTVCWRNGCCAASARPLEHSPGELAWAAWLQRDPEQPEQQPPPRRITTKSLFVFPHLGPEALPACAEGYRPDSLGRCVKVVKVDESAHLEFLLQKLNSQFATESTEGDDDIYDYDSDTDISGPFQFNIPIAVQLHKHDSETEGSGDSVVVVKKQVQPTSSPEVVPDYLETASSESSQTVSSTVIPTTISITADGKFELVTSRAEDELVVELEDLKHETSEPDELMTTEATFEPDVKHRNKTKMKVQTEDDTTETASIQETTTSLDELLETTTIEEKTTKKSETKPNKNDAETSLNIEDKIKVISRFADVTVNDEPVPPEKHNKRKIPVVAELNLEEQVVPRPADLTTSEPPEPVYHDLQKQAALHYHRNHPDPYFESNRDNPYWFRPSKEDNQQPSNPWAKLPSINEYLYGGYRDYDQQHNYQTLYPHLYKPDSARINVRHTVTTHRRGRPMFGSSRQSEQNEPLLPRKNRYSQK